MSKVRFNLDKPQAAETYVLLKFSYNKKRLRYSTGQIIPSKYWNPETQRAKQSNKFSQYPEFNAYLNKLESITNSIYDRFKTDGKIPTIKEFKDKLDIATLKKQDDSIKNFYQFLDIFIENREQSAKFSDGTVKYYKTTRNILKGFDKSIDFGDIDLEFYENFLDYLYRVKKSSANTAGKYIKVLKVVLNDATEKGVNTNLKFRSRHFKKPSQEVDNIYLTVEELTKLYELDLEPNPRLERVRDLFLVGCFTGLRFSDYSTVKPNNLVTIYNKEGLQIDVIKINTKKTGETVTIPLHPIVKVIYQKYECNFPKSLSNQKMNDYLKDVAKLVGLTDKVTLTGSKAGKTIERTFEKWEQVTTHTARRSFATNAFLKGISSITIMAITGHKTERAFLKYIKVTKDQHAAIMAENEFFKMKTLKAV